MFNIPIPAVLGDWQAVAAPSCLLAESPRYVHGHWVWTDIDGKMLYRCRHATLPTQGSTGAEVTSTADIEQIHLPEQIGCVLPTPNPQTWLLFGRTHIFTLEWPPGNKADCYADLPVPFDPALFRFNDGRADAKGRAWVSSLSDKRVEGAALFCLEDGIISQRVHSLIVGNGLAFTADNKAMFLADTRHRALWRFEYDLDNGILGEQQHIMNYNDGAPRPDGACALADGTYLVAAYEGYRLDRYSYEGELFESIDVPFAKPTMPCLGGEGLSTLLICAAATDNTLPNRPGFEGVNLAVCSTNLKGLSEHTAMPLPVGQD